MKGRYINEKDIKGKNIKLLLSEELLQEISLKEMIRIGKFINLGSRSFKIVGVFQDTSGDTEENKLIMSLHNKTANLKGTDVVGTVGHYF